MHALERLKAFLANWAVKLYLLLIRAVEWVTRGADGSAAPELRHYCARHRPPGPVLGQCPRCRAPLAR